METHQQVPAQVSYSRHSPPGLNNTSVIIYRSILFTLWIIVHMMSLISLILKQTWAKHVSVAQWNNSGLLSYSTDWPAGTWIENLVALEFLVWYIVHLCSMH